MRIFLIIEKPLQQLALLLTRIAVPRKLHIMWGRGFEPRRFGNVKHCRRSVGAEAPTHMFLITVSSVSDPGPISML